MINLGSKRECFFDYYIVDKENTTALLKIHKPQVKEVCCVFDKDWERKSVSYPHFFYDNGKYRMYYIACEASKNEKEPLTRVCYAESTDGINWIKPSLGICTYNNSGENNIIIDTDHGIKPFIDNFYVFRDDNPDCPDYARYKGICSNDKKLWAYFSPDGLYFSKGCEITDKGAFDSLNIIFWDTEAKLYRGYIRGFHEIGDLLGEDEFDEKPFELPDHVRNSRIRDIRYIESRDFKSWSRPRIINFGNKKDIPLYTNQIISYERAPHIYLGFPTRYIERKEWTGAYDVLCGKYERLESMKTERRLGLAITDCIFMCSRDGYNFTRYDNAFITPGVEHSTNWVYGDCYPTHGFVKTPCHISSDADYELSFFCMGNHRSLKPNVLVRYSIRQDGFCSFHADDDEKIIVTKPFVFEGKTLFANISTSAFGYIYLELESQVDGEVLKSCEMFGDKIDKKIQFDGDISALSGKEVVMKIRLLDADIYSFKFE